MKEGWSYKKLGEVIDNLRTGLNPRVHFKLNTDDATGYYITVRELKGFEFRVDAKTDRINEQAIRRINERSNLKIGDVLYSGTGTIGRTAVVNELPTWWNIKEGVYAITLNSTKLNPYYFVYATHSDSFKKRVLARTSGTTVRSIPMKELKEIPLLVPPLSEQHSIVSRLDTAFSHIDALKANAEKQLNEARKLFQAELTECMRPKEGWEEKRFGDVCFYHKEQGRFKDMIYIGMEHMESGTGKILGYTSSNEVLSNTFKFNQGEVLYGRLRPYLQKVYVAEFEGCCSTEVFPIRSNKVESGFIKYWLLREETTNKINATSAGCRMPRGNMNEVKLFEFFYPSRKEIQHSIVSHLDSLSSTIRKLEELQQKTLTECDALKQAMLKEVFE